MNEMLDRSFLSILFNVGKHDSLALVAAQVPGASDVLIDFLQLSRDNKALFCLACELLCRFIHAYPKLKVTYSSHDMYLSFSLSHTHTL